MTADAHPIATDRRLAPDAIPHARAVDEQPSAARVATASQSVTLLRERQGGRQQLVDDGVPTRGDRPDGAVREDPVLDPLQGTRHDRSPAVRVEPRVVGQVADRRAQGAQAGELTIRGWSARIGDRMRRQELDGPLGCIQVVMWRLAFARSSTVVGTRPVEAVRECERGVRPEGPCNGLHRR